MAIYKRIDGPDESEDQNNKHLIERIVRTPRLDPKESEKFYHHPVIESGFVVEPFKSGVLYSSGEAHFQAFTDSSTNPPKYSNIPSPPPSSLLFKEAIISSGTPLEEGEDERKQSIFVASGLELDPTLSNAKKTRDNANSVGLNQISPFGCYMHYEDDKKIDYSTNLKAAAEYIDPYSDSYIFENDPSRNTIFDKRNTPATAEDDDNITNPFEQGGAGTVTVYGGAGGPIIVNTNP